MNDSKGAEREGKEEDEGDRLKNSCISSCLPCWLDFQISSTFQKEHDARNNKSSLCTAG